ncbi:MAG TPA: hypothetical protein VJ753_02335 [Rhizomicrobium sp.]|nr:hypothetical protein [Rhizomicrobium sp.]HKY18891.1 hypothetical protein [Rhizomicrobium sp.]
MELPHDYQKKFHSDPAKKKKRAGLARSAWEEQLDNFAAKINPSRIKRRLKPYGHSHIGQRLNACGIHDAEAAYIFFRKLETESRNFPALFEKLTTTNSFPGFLLNRKIHLKT